MRKALYNRKFPTHKMKYSSKTSTGFYFMYGKETAPQHRGRRYIRKDTIEVFSHLFIDRNCEYFAYDYKDGKLHQVAKAYEI